MSSELLTEIKSVIDGQAAAFDLYAKKQADQVDALKSANAALQDRIETLESKRSNAAMADKAAPSFAEKAASHPKLKELAAGNNGRVSFEIAASIGDWLSKGALYSDLLGGSPATGWNVPEVRMPFVGNDPRRPIRLLQALPRVGVSGTNQVEVIKLYNYNPNAAVQGAEGDQKSEADVPTNLQSINLVSIANYLTVSKQLLADVTQLRGYISGLLTHAVALELEDQIVNGSSAHFSGLVEVAQTYAATATADADKLGQAAAYMQTIGWEPSHVLLHPQDHFAIMSERATGTTIYVAGGWTAPSSGMIWGLTPVATPAVAQGTALVLDASQTRIFDRELISLQVGFTDSDFVRNQVKLLVEGRFGFAVISDTAVQKVTL